MRSAVHRRAVLLCVVAATSGLPGARGGLIAQTSPSTPTFPSGVDLITVDAVVLDGEGRPVPGLEREDFVVTEDGRSQEIASFEAIEEQAAPMAMPADADELAAIVTNSAPSRPGRAYAVLLDGIPALDRPSVREALTTFLERSVRVGDLVRLASTSGDLGWSARIPEGRDDLLAVVSRLSGRRPVQGRGREVFATGNVEVGPREDRVERGAGNPASLGTMSEDQARRIVEGHATGNRAIAEEIDARRLDRTRLTHAALRREIQALSTVVGRKSLLLVTPGFSRDSRPELREELRETTRIAQDANVAIYFLDVRGLQTTPGYSAEIAGAPDPSSVVASLVEQDVHDTAGSQDLASDTGGFSIRNTNDLAPGLDRIAAESRVFYLLGIHPLPGKPPGAWRPLRIAVKRSGLTVRARRGYTVRTPDPARATPSVPPSASIPVRLASYVLEPVDAEKTGVAVAMEIDVRGLPSAADSGGPQLNLRLETIARDGGGIDRRELTLSRKATDDNSGRADWQSVRLDLALPPDIYRVRVEVEDSATGRRGVVEQRVAVPGQAVFRISTPILSDTLMPTPEASSPAPAPVAHRSFSASGGRSLFYAFAILGAARDPSTDHSNVTIRFAVKDRSGRTLVEAPETAVAPSPDGRLEQVIALPLAQMPAGEYELQLTVHDRVAGGALDRKETFVVEAAPPPAVTADLEERAGPGPASVAPDLAPILERAGRYVTAYQKAFSDLVAEEDYRQDLSAPTGRFSRRSRAEMIFVSLPGPIPWAAFRDVYEVDGKKVRDREARLERLFRDSPDGAVAAASRARAILDESARYNLGPVRRTLNVPTFALLVLHPDHQHRFSFARAGSKSIDGTQTVQVAFAERLRPTLVAGADGDVVAQGSIWIDADRGTVLRTDVWYSSGLKSRFTWAGTRIVTEYGREARLQVTVPVRMTETYEAGAGLHAGLRDEWGRLRSGFAIKAVASYSGYRRFDVTTDEKYASPPEERP
jgi:VWFA-related protein